MAKYTPEQIEVLRLRPKGELTPGEFIALFKADKERKKKVYRRNQNTDEELYDVFIKDIKAGRSPNQFKEAVKRAGLSVSHDRAAALFPVLMARAKAEVGMIDVTQQMPTENSSDSILFTIFKENAGARKSVSRFKQVLRNKGHSVSHSRTKTLFDSFKYKVAIGVEAVADSIQLTDVEEVMYTYYTTDKRASRSPYYLQLALSKAGYKKLDVESLYNKFRRKHEELEGRPRPLGVLETNQDILTGLYKEYGPFKSAIYVHSTLRKLGHEVPFVVAEELHNKLKAKEDNGN